MDKMESEQLTYPEEHRENFELEIDPKLYVKDQYYYRNRRIKTALCIFGGCFIMTMIVFLSVFLIGKNYKSKQSEGWQVMNSDANNNTNSIKPVGPTIDSYRSETTLLEAQEPTATTTEYPHLESKRQFVRLMAREVWDKYERHAWGQDALRPLTKDYSWNQFGLNSGLTIVSSMSTLWVMDMREEFSRGKEWICNNLNFSRIIQQINVQHTVTHYIGSLLSSYALTGDDFFLRKAIEIADVLKPAYATATGLPYGKLIPKTRALFDTIPTLSELGGQYLEYNYLSDIAADRQYKDRINKIQKFFQNIEKPNGLYLKRVYIESGQWRTDVSTLSKAGENFYSTLMKAHIQSNFTSQQEMLEMYKKAIDAIDNVGMFATSHLSGLVYARNFNNAESKFGGYMSFDSCYLGAMLAQGAETLKRAQTTIFNANAAKREMQRINRHWNLAVQLTETCHQAARRSITGLPPHHFHFNGTLDATNSGLKYKEFDLGSELAESYFILWRLTGNFKYRDYAWEYAQSIYKHCRTENGYCGLKDVSRLPAPKTNYQNAQFLAATLKYLYLIFADDEQLPLSQWIFNAFGQPLPICGANPKYSKCIN